MFNPDMKLLKINVCVASQFPETTLAYFRFGKDFLYTGLQCRLCGSVLWIVVDTRYGKVFSVF